MFLLSYGYALSQFPDEPLWLKIPALGLVWLLAWGTLELIMLYRSGYPK